MTRTVAIVQARLGSVRLPRKVLRPVGEHTVLGLTVARLRRATSIDDIWLATTVEAGDDELASYASDVLGLPVSRGSESDVLQRYADAADAAAADIVIRITADCPLIDPTIVDEVVALRASGGHDYASNAGPATFPDGLDVEVFTNAALQQAAREAVAGPEREHVTPYLRDAERFSQGCVSNDVDLSGMRWTVDLPEDLAVIDTVIKHLHNRTDFSWTEVLELTRTHPEYFMPNQDVTRNTGGATRTGQKLWGRAKRVIPGGNMLLSKRAEMFLPDEWPAYFSRAKGCTVWDLDDVEYTDMATMGIGTNILGYGDERVDAAVREVIDKGNMSTLNAPEEVYVAEKLVEMHPWADMARFLRGGGEANALSIRLARAASGREEVAFCGYHGWHDWYLAANLTKSGDGLDEHLLPGLDPKGVPSSMTGTAHPFMFNDIAALEKLVAERPIGVIKMEVQRNLPPEPGFLEAVRALATREDIVLIFDECTSGFRETFGGLHLKYGVEPDLAVFGKTLGNGYAISAVIGRAAIMQEAQSTFVSSTFWTERIGSAAALAALDAIEEDEAWARATATGLTIRELWTRVSEAHGLPLSYSGLPALSAFVFDAPVHGAFKTLLTQQMLDRGFLATNAVYSTTAHTPAVLERYEEALDATFGVLAACDSADDAISQLRGPVAHSGFARLN